MSRQQQAAASATETLISWIASDGVNRNMPLDAVRALVGVLISDHAYLTSWRTEVRGQWERDHDE